MNTQYRGSVVSRVSAAVAVGLGLAAGFAAIQAGVNPQVPFYGWGSITATPAYPIVGENTHIQVVVGNTGDEPASNVQVQVSFNDWGVTFSGWQSIGTVIIPSIPAGGTATAEFDHVFQNQAHTCLEALIVGANQNDDLNDDRGQINLEVIHAGDSFTYDVPVRNDGDAPLDLLVLGRCQIKDAGGVVDGAHPCKEVVEVVHLEPGEEVLVPIEVDLSGLLPGQAIGFIVEAFDLGAPDPWAPANRNHVELVIVRETARNLKQDAQAILTALAPQTGDRALRNRLEAAAKHVQKALQPKGWADDSRLVRAGGAAVVAQELAAIRQVQGLLESRLPLALKVQLTDVALKLTDADRILAATAIRDAGGSAVAAARLQEGDAARQQGDYEGAILSYFKAWQAVRGD
ncbi:MAG TPA: CARDB domain-containing protein [Verrucomicrobiota bacterium]|nr:CARDB domain-containing protein [Verrucomicrobiota bacterium]HNU50482.1 CARDB domain-containing protein [Verrucomicrobiota bacterium]